MTTPARCLSLLSVCSVLFAQPSSHSRPAKPGVKDQSIQIPLARLVPDKKFSIPGSPDWIAVERDVWVSNKPRNNVTRIDPRKNLIVQTISGLHKPCSGLAIGFGSLWVPNCGDQTLARIDQHSGKITATFPMGIADSEGGIAVGAGSIWILTDKQGTLARIDPDKNEKRSQISLPAGCFTPAFGFGSVWVSCTAANLLIRVDPKTEKIVARIPVGPQPRFLSVGEGAVWTLNQGDGSVTRVSPASNKNEATIALGIPGEGGDISAGEGSVWATSFGFPVSRIDPHTNRVVQQFVGEGGDAIRAGGGAVWLSNYKFGSEWRLDPEKISGIRP